jgi:hypothetical protein
MEEGRRLQRFLQGAGLTMDEAACERARQAFCSEQYVTGTAGCWASCWDEATHLIAVKRLRLLVVKCCIDR